MSDNMQQLKQQTIDQFSCNGPHVSVMSASEQPVSTLLLVCFCFVMQHTFTDENFVQFIPALTKMLITGL